MSAHTLPTIVEAPASESGALDGFKSVCQCGDVASFSFERMARQYAAEHADWHARKR